VAFPGNNCQLRLDVFLSFGGTDLSTSEFLALALLAIVIVIALIIVAVKYSNWRARVTEVKQPTEVEATRSTPPSSELADLMDEISKWRNYLKKLEELRTQGKISEKVYKELKNEYLNKLKELEKKVEGLQKSPGSSS